MPGGRTHLDYESRMLIEDLIGRGFSFEFIASRLGAHPTTVAREIKRNRIKRDGRADCRTKRNTCDKSSKCRVKGLCGDSCRGRCATCKQVRCSDKCPRYVPRKCEKLAKKPYVCNGCPYFGFDNACDCERWFYDAREAEDAAVTRKVASREGIDITAAQMHEMVKTVKPLMEKGQSIEHIWSTHPGKFPVSARTFRRYVDERACGVSRVEEVRAIRYKRRRRKIDSEHLVADKPVYDGRRYEDFNQLGDAQTMSAVEMDCVESARGSKKTILTLFFRRYGFQAMILLQEHTKGEVARALDDIEKAIGLDAFRLCMGTLLTDHGHEFNDFGMIESSCTVRGAKRCSVYYCDPSRPDQKGRCEKNHVELRRILPKKTCFAGLDPADVSLISSHVNSYTRAALGGAAPIDLAKQALPGELFDALGIVKIPPEEVVLKPSLLPHML